MHLFRKMYAQSFFHTPIPFCGEEDWGSHHGFSVSLTLPVWTGERLSNLPKVTNNSLTFPNDFQYMCSSTSLLWRVCVSVLLWLPVYDDFPFFVPLPVLSLKAQFEGKLVCCSYIYGNKSVCKLMIVEDVGLSIFIVFSPNSCWKMFKACSCGSKMYCPVLISVCNYDVWL